MNRTDSGAVLHVPRAVALAVIAVLVAAASGAAFAESYRGLFDWAAGHGLTGTWAYIWPLQVDIFIAVGELALFVALVDRWPPRSRWAAWAVTGAGLAVSVAGNVGHVSGHSPAARVTAAVPPVAAAFALAVALGVLKRVVEAHHEKKPETASARASVSASAPGKLPSLREIQARQNCGQGTARKIRAELAAYERSRGGPVHPTPAPAARDVPAGDAPPPAHAPAGALNGHGTARG